MNPAAVNNTGFTAATAAMIYQAKATKTHKTGGQLAQVITFLASSFSLRLADLSFLLL